MAAAKKPPATLPAVAKAMAVGGATRQKRPSGASPRPESRQSPLASLRTRSASSGALPLLVEGRGSRLRQSGRAVLHGTQSPTTAPTASASSTAGPGALGPAASPALARPQPPPPPRRQAPVQQRQAPPQPHRVAAGATSLAWDRALSHPDLQISRDGLGVLSGDCTLEPDGELHTRAAVAAGELVSGTHCVPLVYESGNRPWLCAGVFDPSSPAMQDPNGSPVTSWSVSTDTVLSGSTHKACWLYSFYFDHCSADGEDWTFMRPDEDDLVEFNHGDVLFIELALPKGDLAFFFQPADGMGGRKLLGRLKVAPDRPYQVLALLGGEGQGLRLGSGSVVQELPPWLQQERLSTRKTVPTLRDTALRGISLRQLLQLAELVQRSLECHEVMDTNPRSRTQGQRITWETVTMYHVCEHFVLPLTQAAACSYVELVAGDCQTPQWMVSHAWSTLFPCTVSMLTFHAKSRCSTNPMATLYWCCTLANNQHDLAELREEDIMQSPFARVLLSQDCLGTVLLCDPAVTPLKRSWCVFEAYISERLRGHALGCKGVHFLDVASGACGADGSTWGPEAVAILQDAVAGNWQEVAGSEGLHFPLEVARVGTQVDIAASEASVTADRNAILNFVAAGKASRDEAPPGSHERYEALNAFIHGIFASAELYRLACERPEGCLEAMSRLLSMRADPNKFVREGNTSLFAVVGADPVAGAPVAGQDIQPMLELLLGAQADPNCINSRMKTVLDAASGLPEATQALLRTRGARPMHEVAAVQEERLNEELQRIVCKGFSTEREAFGGTGGGGTGAKLMRVAEQSLLEAAAILKRFPAAPCLVETRATKQDKLRLRGPTVCKYLEASGCRNPLEMHSSDYGPLLRLALSLKPSSSNQPPA